MIEKTEFLRSFANLVPSSILLEEFFLETNHSFVQFYFFILLTIGQEYKQPLLHNGTVRSPEPSNWHSEQCCARQGRHKKQSDLKKKLDTWYNTFFFCGYKKLMFILLHLFFFYASLVSHEILEKAGFAWNLISHADSAADFIEKHKIVTTFVKIFSLFS